MPSTGLHTDQPTDEIEASQNSSDALSKTSVPKSFFVSSVFSLSENGSTFDMAVSRHPEVSHQQVERSCVVPTCDNNEQAGDMQMSVESVVSVSTEPYVDSPREDGGFVEDEHGMGMPTTDLSLAENS
ncbi:hypothetical protein V6N12_017330 [Hibiscus sabdariffa]|uniref:Uncharacterized protein n=1 Tax=Hibiscus sabdariffa TaxID=183260 RepID=A0ABR2CFN1_9ROSI